MSSIVTLGYSKGILLVPSGYGGHLVIQALAQLGSDAINVLPGTRVLGFGTLTMNGKVVSSPVTLTDEGYYQFVASLDGIVATLNVAVIILATTIVKIQDIIGPTSPTSSYQNMSNSLVSPYGKFANTRPAVTDAECQLLLTTNKAVHVSIRTMNQDGTQSEISKVSATSNGRWLSPQIILPQGLNNTKLVLPINTGDQIIGTLTPPPTPPTPVVPTTNSVIILPNGLVNTDDQEFTTSAGSITNSFNLVNDNPNDGDATYVLMSLNEQFGSWRLPSYSPSARLSYIYSVAISAIARRISGPQGAVLWGPYVKNTFTGKRDLPGMALETSGSYLTHSVTYFNNPFTGNPWSVGDLQSGYLHLGCQRDLYMDNLRVTQVHLTVNEVLA